MSSYRAEAYGKLSWIIFLKHLLTILPQHPVCTFHSYLDNLEVVRQTQLTTDFTAASCALMADYDIMIAISNEQDRLHEQHISLTNSKHVKGHQDSTKQYHQLTRPEQLNTRADELATTALKEVSKEKTAPGTIPNPHCPIYLKDQGQLITSKEQHTLRWKWSELRLQQY